MSSMERSVYGRDGLLKLRPAVDPGKGRIPAESLVRDDWQRGRTIADMSGLYGVSETHVRKYIAPRVKRWRKGAA